MTEKQIERIQLTIKQYKAALAAEKKIFGGYDDSAGRRYDIALLYILIADYKGAITYKKWFNKNFDDDAGDIMLSLNWSVAYFEFGKLAEAKVHTIDTAFQNVYLHNLLLDKGVEQIDMYELMYNMLEFTTTNIDQYKKAVTKSYIDWLQEFIETDEYKNPVNKYIALGKLMNDGESDEKHSQLIDHQDKLVEDNLKKV